MPDPPELREGHSMVLAADIQALTDEQRQTIIDWFATNPDGGYKAALAHVGIRATKAEARALLHADDEIRDARLKGMNLDEGSLFKRLGAIAKDEDHKDTFRAVTWGLNALHRWHENSGVEHSGTMEVSTPDVAAAIERFTVLATRAVREASGERAGDVPQLTE